MKISHSSSRLVLDPCNDLLNIKHFSERNLINPIDSNKKSYLLNKIYQHLNQNEVKKNNIVDEHGTNNSKQFTGGKNISLPEREDSSVFFNDRFKFNNYSQKIEFSKTKSEFKLLEIKERLTDLKNKKKDFILKQRKFILKKDNRTCRILPRVVLSNKEKVEDTDDVRMEFNSIFNETEYVKKYLLPKETKSHPELNKLNSKKVDFPKIQLQDLLPLDELIKQQKCFSINIVNKENDFIYEVKRKKMEVEKNTYRSDSLHILTSNFTDQKTPSFKRIRNNESILKLKKSKILLNGKNSDFKPHLAKQRSNENIEQNIKQEVAKLKTISHEIYKTFNLAINDLYNQKRLDKD